jgi:imidazolonepropionase-like amidohydrolase
VLPVTGHIPRGMTEIEGVKDGMDQINHVFYLTAVMVDPKTKTIDPNSEEVKNFVKLLLDHHTVVDPTLALMELTGHATTSPVSAFEPGITKIAPELREGLETMGVPPAEEKKAAARFQLLLQTVRILHRAGVPIVVGTDQAVPGYSVDREIELYVKAGFTPMEALQAASLVPARVMGMENVSGTIEPGKRADIILVDGNPLENISDIRRVSTVFAGGKMYQPPALWKSVGFAP